MNEKPPEPAVPEEDVILTAMPRIARWIITISTGLWAHVWDGLTQWMPKILTAWWDGFSENVSTIADDVEKAVTETTPEFSGFAGEMSEIITDLRKLPFPMDALLIVYAFFNGASLYVREKVRLYLLPVGQDLNQSSQTDIAPLEAVAREWFRTPEDRTRFTDLLEKHNLNPEAQRILLESIEQFPPVDAVYMLRNRGIIPDDSSAEWFIQKLGFSAAGAQTMLNLRWVIPPLTDIIRLAVREAFSPEAIEAFDLMQHYPEELTGWAEKQGLSRDWAEKYWIAHWDLPSLQQGFEMMWRTDFSEEDLDLLMRFADVNPYFRPYLKKIAHRPYTRVDARRMADVGVLDRKQLKIAYKDIGYDEEHAEAMTEFTERYNRRSHTKDLVNEWLWMLEEGTVGEEEAGKEITLLLDDENEALFEVAKVLARKAIRYYSDQAKNIKKLYTSRRISSSTASDRLDALGVEPQAKADMLEEWTESRRAALRYPTKADLEKYFKAGAISYEDWAYEMSELGYAQKYIRWQMHYLLIEKGLSQSDIDRILKITDIQPFPELAERGV